MKPTLIDQTENFMDSEEEENNKNSSFGYTLERI